MPRRLLRFTFSFALLASVPVAARGAEGDWPTFRGASRTAVAPDTNLLEQWPSGGPKLVWETAGMGRGYSSPAIADGKIYTMGDSLSIADDKDEYLVCLNQSDGGVLWISKTGPAWESGQESWQSSRSTPTVDGDMVYALTAFGVLIAKSTTSGEDVWRRDLKEEFGGKKADGWGYSESVLIDGDRLICTPGGTENTVVALDKKTGEQIWSCSWPDVRGAGHSSAVIAEVGGKKVYVQVTGSGAMGIGADGELLWTYDIPRTTAVIPTPIVRDDLVFFTAGYGTGGALVRQVPSADGIMVEEIYPPTPNLQNKHGGVVLVDNYVYGDSGDSGTPFCAELMTGEVMWKSRGSGKKSASVAAADGHLYFRYSDGTMTLVKAKPNEFEEVGSFKIPGSGDRPSWAHPVIADGKLYLREGDTMLCYALR